MCKYSGMRRYWSVLCFLWLGANFSCKTVKAPEPEYVASTKRFRSVLSTVNLPIELPIRLIEEQVNKKVGSLLYEDNSYTSPAADNLKMIVLRKKPIKLSVSGGDLVFSVPVNIWAMGRWEPCSFCPSVEKETRFDLDVFLRARPEIRKDYSFALGARSGGFEWKNKPVISLGPINVPIDRLLEDVIEEQLSSVSRDIDRQVNSAINLRSEIEKLWSVAQEPVLLDDSTQTWLQMNPTALVMAPVSSNKESILMQFGLESYIEGHIGRKPDPIEKKLLPELRQSAKSSPGFTVQVRAILGFTEASEIAARQMMGQEFTYGKRKLRVEGISVYGKGERAIVHLVVSGSLKGEFYLSGRPVYNTATDELSLEELDYDIQTRNVLVKAGSWLLSSTFRNLLQEKLRFSFASEMNAIRGSLSDALRNYQYKGLFRINGALQKMEVQDIYVGENQFDIALNLLGNAKLVLLGLGI